MRQLLDTESTSSPTSDVNRTSRRRLLTLLAALPGPLRLLSRNDAGAKQKGKNRKKRKKHGLQGDGGGGSGGGGYAPDGEEREFLDLINDYRRRNGAGNLSLNNQLGAAAEFHAKDMAKKNYFSHKLSNGDSAEQNIERFGYTNYRFVGENIAAGYESATKVMDAWKKSAEHDKNMRDKNFAEIGIGRAYDKRSKYGWYWTTTFGKRGG